MNNDENNSAPAIDSTIWPFPIGEVATPTVQPEIPTVTEIVVDPTIAVDTAPAYSSDTKPFIPDPAVVAATITDSTAQNTPPTEGPDYYGHDDTQLLAVNAADVLRFHWQMFHPNESLPEPEKIDKDEIKIAIETIRQLNDIDANLHLQIIPDNDVRFLNYGKQIPIPRSVMLIYKSLMFNLHNEGDKVARWGSWWKTVGVAFIVISVIEAMMLLAR